jgi:hypothetical protein
LTVYKKRIGSKLSFIMAVAFWGGSMFLVYNKNYATPKTSDLIDLPMDETISGEFQNWMNVNMGQGKIGYTMQSFKKSPLGYILKDYSLIRLPMGGTIREIYLDSYAVLNLDFSLKNFTFGMVSGDYSTDVFGEWRQGKLSIRMKSQNSESQASFDAVRGVFLPSVVPLLARSKGFPQGEFSMPTFDPFSLAMNEMQVQIMGQEEIETKSGKKNGYRMDLYVSGMATKMWVDSEGHVLRELETGSMEMVATNQEDALNVPEVKVGDVDILNALAVPCDGKIDNPRQATDITVQIDGIDGKLFDLNDDVQTVISTDPLILRIHTGQVNKSSLGDPTRFLSAEPFIQSTDPRIVTTALDIVGGVESPAEKARLLGEWVFKNVEKDYSISLPSAVDVLTVRKGDCNEHTALYTALARAVALPTKICIGIVYKDGLFYYHAWPAVHLDGWKEIDPTFGQDTADATHIKLLEGGFERQADLMRIVGKIKIKLIENSSEKTL